MRFGDAPNTRTNPICSRRYECVRVCDRTYARSGSDPFLRNSTIPIIIINIRDLTLQNLFDSISYIAHQGARAVTKKDCIHWLMCVSRARFFKKKYEVGKIKATLFSEYDLGVKPTLLFYERESVYVTYLDSGSDYESMVSFSMNSVEFFWKITVEDMDLFSTTDETKIWSHYIWRKRV